MALKRNNVWVNTYNAQLLRAWRGNVDVQFIADARGTAQYVTRVAHYASNATKPETSALDQRFRFALARMPQHCSLSSRLQRQSNAVICARQVPIQQAVAVLLGQRTCPVVECSVPFVHLNIAPRSEVPVTINARAVRDADDDESESIYAAKAFFAAYYTRPLEGDSPLGVPWDELSLFEFASWFALPENNKDGGTRFTMGNGMKLLKRKKQAALVTVPYVTADLNDERSAYAMLKLWLPHRDEAELLYGFDGPTAAVDALRAKWHQLRDGGHALVQRRREMEEARADFDGRDSDAEADVPEVLEEPGAEDLNHAMLDAGCDVRGPLLMPGTGATTSSAILVWAPDKFRRARGFVAEQENWAKAQREQELAQFDRVPGAESHDAAVSVISAHEQRLASMVEGLSSQQRDAYDCVVHQLQPGSQRQTPGHCGRRGRIWKVTLAACCGSIRPVAARRPRSIGLRLDEPRCVPRQRHQH